MIANDDFADADVLTGASGNITPITYGPALATLEGSEPGSEHASLWWEWTCPANGYYQFSTNGSWSEEETTPGGDCGLDTVLTVFTGSALGALTQAVENDDDDSDPALFGCNSRVRFTATSGVTYRIRVALYYDIDEDWNRGELHLSWALVLEGPEGALLSDANAVQWVPLGTPEFTLTLGTYDYYLPGVLHGFEFRANPAPDPYRVVAYSYRVIELHSTGERELMNVPLSFNPMGYALGGWSGGGGDLSYHLAQLAGGGAFDTGDAAGRIYIGEVVITYDDGRVRRYRTAPMVFSDMDGGVYFETHSERVAASYYYWGQNPVYFRSRPGDVEPTTTATGPFGNPEHTIHAVAGTQVYVGSMGWSRLGAHTAFRYSLTGVGDDSWRTSPYEHVGLVGPRVGGATETVVTRQWYNPSNPASNDTYRFTIVWE